MGNEQSQEADEFRQFMSKYTVLKELQDSKMGGIKILFNNSTGEEVIMREFTSDQASQMNGIYTQFQNRRSLENENIIKMIGLGRGTESVFLNTFHKIFVAFQYMNDTLEQDLNSRQTPLQLYTEMELQQIMRQTIRGISYFTKNGYSLQNISLKTIFISKKGVYQVSDPQSFDKPNNYQTALKQGTNSMYNNVFYFSPALLESLKQREVKPNHDPQQSDVFTLGMIFLNCALIENLSSCYLLHDFMINYDMLNEQISHLSQLYSNSVIDLITRMTEKQEKYRPDFNELESLLFTIETPMNGHSRFNSQTSQIFASINLNETKNFMRPEQDLSINSFYKMEESMNIETPKPVIIPKNFQNIPIYVPPPQRPSDFAYERPTVEPQTKQDDNIPCNLHFNPQFDDHIEDIIKKYEKQPDLTGRFRDNTEYKARPTFQKTSDRIYVEEVLPDGSQYQGDKLHGVKDGKGRLTYINGIVYFGEWVDNKMCGRGILYFPNKKPAYDGEWENNFFEGRGILYNENPEIFQGDFNHNSLDFYGYWTQYDGEFKDDCKEGVGTVYLTNGDSYMGTFKNDFATGPGTYKQKNGIVIKGIWKNNQITNQIIVMDKNDDPLKEIRN